MWYYILQYSEFYNTAFNSNARRHYFNYNENSKIVSICFLKYLIHVLILVFLNTSRPLEPKAMSLTILSRLIPLSSAYLELLLMGWRMGARQLIYFQCVPKYKLFIGHYLEQIFILQYFFYTLSTQHLFSFFEIS